MVGAPPPHSVMNWSTFAFTVLAIALIFIRNRSRLFRAVMKLIWNIERRDETKTNPHSVWLE